MSELGARHEALARAWVSAWTDPAGTARLSAIAAPDLIVHLVNRTYLGAENFIAAMTQHVATLTPSVVIRMIDIVTDTTRAALEWETVVAATGAAFEPPLRGACWMRFERERVCEVWVYWEPTGPLGSLDSTPNR